MTHRIAGQIALLAFGCALMAGLGSGNSLTTVLWRALVAMLGGFFIGHIVAATARLLVREHLQRRKVAIDREHVAALAPAPSSAAEVQAAAQERG